MSIFNTQCKNCLRPITFWDRLKGNWYYADDERRIPMHKTCPIEPKVGE